MAKPVKFIHLRHADGRTQRLVAGKQGEAVAKTWQADGWTRYTPEEPYDPTRAPRAAPVAASADKRGSAPRKRQSRAKTAKTSAAAVPCGSLGGVSRAGVAAAAPEPAA